MTVHKDFQSSTEKNILEHLLQGGSYRRKGEELLFNTYSYLIQEGIRKHSLNNDESFDAYADSVLSVIEKIINGSFEGRSSLKTFLYQVYHNKCVDLVRKNMTEKNKVHRASSISEMFFQMADTAKTILQSLVDQADIHLLKQKLDELGENCRRLLLLSADGYSDKEIAAVLEYKSADVAKTSRLRCLEKLRKLYSI